MRPSPSSRHCCTGGLANLLADPAAAAVVKRPVGARDRRPGILSTSPARAAITVPAARSAAGGMAMQAISAADVPLDLKARNFRRSDHRKADGKGPGPGPDLRLGRGFISSSTDVLPLRTSPLVQPPVAPRSRSRSAGDGGGDPEWDLRRVETLRESLPDPMSA